MDSATVNRAGVIANEQLSHCRILHSHALFLAKCTASMYCASVTMVSNFCTFR